MSWKLYLWIVTKTKLGGYIYSGIDDFKHWWNCKFHEDTYEFSHKNIRAYQKKWGYIK